MKFAPYSFSKIDNYDQCPRCFKYNQIVKPPKKPQNLEPLIKGGAIHSILEHFPEQSTHKHAKKYFHFVEPFLKSPEGWNLIMQPAMKEMQLALDYDLKPCSYKDKNCLFRGIVDRVIISDGVLHLIDFKSGKYKDIQYQNFNQLMFYAIWFFISYPEIMKIKISYMYVEHASANDIVLERQYFDNYCRELLTRITKIESDEVYEKNVSRLCQYCDFEEYCKTDNT